MRSVSEFFFAICAFECKFLNQNDYYASQYRAQSFFVTPSTQLTSAQGTVMPLTWMTTPRKMSDVDFIVVDARRIFSARCSSNCTRSLALFTAIYVPKSSGSE